MLPDLLLLSFFRGVVANTARGGWEARKMLNIFLGPPCHKVSVGYQNRVKGDVYFGREFGKYLNNEDFALKLLIKVKF